MFPGHLDSQVAELHDQDNEWAISQIIAHQGSGTDALFEAVWKSGDQTWVPYSSIKHLDALKAYFEAISVEDIADLGQGSGVAPDDPQVFSEYLDTLPVSRRKYMKEQEHKTYQVARHPLRPSPPPPAFYLFAISMAPLPLPLPAVTNANLTCDEDGFIILLDVVSNDYHQFPVTAFCEFIRYDSIICKVQALLSRMMQHLTSSASSTSLPVE